MSKIDTLDKATSVLGTCIKLVRLLATGGATIEQLQGPIGSRTKRSNLLAYLAAGCPKLELNSDRVVVVNTTTIKVNCTVAPKLPFNESIIETNRYPGGWVTVEKRSDGLYVDGVKVILHLEDGQNNGRTMQGNKLRIALAERTSVHPNIIDAAIEHNLMPDDWAVDEKGRTRYIFSFAVVFRSSDGDLCLRYWYWDDGRWQADDEWLDNDWYDTYPSALLSKVEPKD